MWAPVQLLAICKVRTPIALDLLCRGKIIRMQSVKVVGVSISRDGARFIFC
jgi:hypothetical protein